MSFGIALSGGGCKGAAHVGVLLALEENNMFPSSIAGASAGSIISGMYASGMTPKAMKELVIELSKTGYRLIDADFIGIIKTVEQFFSHRSITLSGL